MIIVDLDDTLIDTRSTLRIRKLSDAAVIGPPGIEAYLLERAHERRSGRELIEEAAAVFDLDEETRDAMIGEYFSNHPHGVRIPLFEGAREALEALRDAGERIICLTTGIREQQVAKIDGAGIRDLFDEVVVIAEPQDKSLVYADLSAQVEPSSIVVIGDKLSDVAPAASLGMRAVLYGRPLDAWNGENAVDWSRILELVLSRESY
jgi:FMN phosphatase YigB (HAD superfamily)